jgi:hypothetical protein
MFFLYSYLARKLEHAQEFSSLTLPNKAVKYSDSWMNYIEWYDPSSSRAESKRDYISRDVRSSNTIFLPSFLEILSGKLFLLQVTGWRTDEDKGV